MSSIAARRANKRACPLQPNDILSRGTHGILAQMGYIVVPPSVNDAGEFYEWVVPPSEVELADAPQWLIDLSYAKAEKTTTDRIVENTSTGEKIGLGGRRNFLFHRACALRAYGLDE